MSNVIASTQSMTEKIFKKVKEHDELLICLTKVTIDALKRFEEKYLQNSNNSSIDSPSEDNGCDHD
jgi:hypothetical protein